MYNPWIQTTVWRWPEGKGGGGWEEGCKGRRMGTSVMVSIIKIKLKENLKMYSVSVLSRRVTVLIMVS